MDEVEAMRREIGTREGDALISAAELEHTDWCVLDRDHAGRCQREDGWESPPRTAAATEARVRRRLERNAQELRDVGYLVIDRATIAELEIEETDYWTSVRVVTPKRAGVERHEFDRLPDGMPRSALPVEREPFECEHCGRPAQPHRLCCLTCPDRLCPANAPGGGRHIH